MKTIKGNLILEKDTIFNESLTVEGNILGKGGVRYNLTVKGNLDCFDLDCFDLDCEDLNCWNLNCFDLDCWNLNCEDLNCEDLNCRNLNCFDLDCGDLNCWDLSFCAIAITYNSFKCKSWKSGRNNYIIKCLDGDIEIRDKPKICDKCGSELKENKENEIGGKE